MSKVTHSQQVSEPGFKGKRTYSQSQPSLSFAKVPSQAHGRNGGMQAETRKEKQCQSLTLGQKYKKRAMKSAFRSHRLPCRTSLRTEHCFPMANGPDRAGLLSVRAQNLHSFLFCDHHQKASTFSLLSLQTSQENKRQRGLWLRATPHPAPTQWVPVPRPHCPVRHSEETAPPTPNKAAPMVVGVGVGGREKDFLFGPLLKLTAWTVASKEQTLFSERWTGLSFK